MSQQHSHNCNIPPASSPYHQTLDELDFERGIWYAAQSGDLERVKKLVNQGTSIDKRDRAGYTALHYAARSGHRDICTFLLSNGADVNAVTRSGRASALHRAASAGRYNIVRLLLDANADVTLKDDDGKTVLHRAAESQNLAICQDLINVYPMLKSERDKRGKVPYDYIQNTELAAAFSLKHS